MSCISGCKDKSVRRSQRSRYSTSSPIDEAPLTSEIERCSVRASATVRFLIVFLATKECKRGATSIMRCPCSHLSSQKSAANWISYTDFAEYSPRVFYFQFKTFYHLDVMLLKINKTFLHQKNVLKQLLFLSS